MSALTVLTAHELVGAGRAMDVLIAKHVLGLPVCDALANADPKGACSLYGQPHYSADGEWGGNDDRGLPRYSTDIAAAWALFEFVNTEGNFPGGAWSRFAAEMQQGKTLWLADNAADAAFKICRAVLIALGVARDDR